MSSSSIGQRFVFTSFGESHGRCIGATVDGCPAGLKIEENDIQTMLDLRKPGQSIVTTQRKEDDKVEILSGVYRGHTTGAPITMVIWNKDQRSKDYDNLTMKPRPGHSDYPAFIKYNGFNDIRGGGRFSGRLTATFVMAGAIARKLLLKTLGIETFSYTCQVGNVKMKDHAMMKMKNSVYSNEVRCPDPKIATKMRETILAARRKGDSIGGIIESLTVNLPVGLGEPIFGSLESDLSKALFSIPAVKGVEFGSGFHGSTLYGSENNDEFLIKNGKIQTKTNNAGGILGGISTGMPIVLRVAFKPASSISKKQRTVDLKTKKPVSLIVQGRHDPCVVPRAPPVVDSLVSVVLADHAIRAGFIPAVIRYEMSDINKLRDRIDKITFDILKLLKERNDTAKEIGNLKNNLGIGVTNEERENQLRANVLTLCKEIRLDEKTAMTMLNFLLNESVKIQSEGKQTHLSVFLKAKKLEKEGKKIIHMEVGEPDFLPPKIVSSALSEVYDKGYTKYGDSKGMPDFREALAKYVTEKFGAETLDQNILVSPGARFSVFLAISSLLSPGNEIIVIEPAWPAYRDNALNSGIKVRTIHTTLENKWEPRIEDIKNVINENTRMIVLNYPNNPTGKILPENLQDQIMEVAIKNNLYVLSDEIYSAYANKPWKSILTYRYNKSVITQSFSKSHAMTGFRIGYAVSSPEIIEKMSKLQALALTNVSEPIQYVAMKALKADTTDNTKTIRNRLETILKKAKTMQLDFVEPDGAMYLFAKIRQDNFDSVDFTNKLLDTGVAIAPGEGFGNYQGFVRISACQPEDTLNQGMQIIEDRLKSK